MIVFNTGVPRSGTTWAFNVFREIWERRGTPFRTENPNTAQDVQRCLGQIDPAANVIVHFHDLTDAAHELVAGGSVRPFFNFRDPRDVVVSQMRLHGVTFDEAVRMTVVAYRYLPVAAKMPGIMLIPYEHIADHAEALVFQMATRLGVLLERRDVREIAENTGIDRHREVMQRVNAAEALDAGTASIHTGRRTIRYDTRHLITDDHIQSGRIGRWKHELDDEHRRLVCERFAPVTQLLGYDD